MLINNKNQRKFPLAWLGAQVPAAGIALVNAPGHLIGSGVGMAAWMAVTAFAAKVWRELEDDAVKGVASFLRQAPGKSAFIVVRTWHWLIAQLAARSPGFRNRYLTEVSYRYGKFNDRGLGLINANRLSLKDVYIDLEIDPDPILENAAHDLLKREYREPRPIWDYLNQLTCGTPLAIIGPPGTGKTTLIYHVLLVYAQNAQRQFRATSRIPFYVEIRLLPDILGVDSLTKWGSARDSRERPPGIPRLVAALTKLLPATYRDLGSPPAGWLERIFRRGHGLLLLDGLDEVRSEPLRRGLSRWFDEELSSSDVRDSAAIITARPGGYRSAPLSRAVALGLKPFSRDQAGKFISRWYLANETVSHGNVETPEVKREAVEGATRLLDALRKAPRLYDLTSNPLLLTMVCMVHRYRGTLPGKRVQLYSEICQVLLERWRQARGIADEFTVEQKLSVLQPLAAEMMQLGVRELPDAEARKIIAPIVARFNISPSQADVFLTRIQEDSGLILEREPGRWAFAHLSFQEYLTAAHWRATHAPAVTVEWILQSWWRETMLLYVPYEDATEIIECALVVGSTEAIALALDVGKEALSVSPATKEKLDVIWARVLHDPNDPRFAIAAAALLVLNANREYHALADAVQIRAPITQAEYQLFVFDTVGTSTEIERQILRTLFCPAHWLNGVFAGSPNEPVIGLLPWHRCQFAAWLRHHFPGYIHWPSSLNERHQATGATSRDVEGYWSATREDLKTASELLVMQLATMGHISAARMQRLGKLINRVLHLCLGTGATRYDGLLKAAASLTVAEIGRIELSEVVDRRKLKDAGAALALFIDEADEELAPNLGTGLVGPRTLWSLVDASYSTQGRDEILAVIAAKRVRVEAGCLRLDKFFVMPERSRQAHFLRHALVFAEAFFSNNVTGVQQGCWRWLLDLIRLEQNRIPDLGWDRPTLPTKKVRRGLEVVAQAAPLLTALQEIFALRRSDAPYVYPEALAEPLRISRLEK